MSQEIRNVSRGHLAGLEPSWKHQKSTPRTGTLVSAVPLTPSLSRDGKYFGSHGPASLSFALGCSEGWTLRSADTAEPLLGTARPTAAQPAAGTIQLGSLLGLDSD